MIVGLLVEMCSALIKGAAEALTSKEVLAADQQTKNHLRSAWQVYLAMKARPARMREKNEFDVRRFSDECSATPHTFIFILTEVHLEFLLQRWLKIGSFKSILLRIVDQRVRAAGIVRRAPLVNKVELASIGQTPIWKCIKERRLGALTPT